MEPIRKTKKALLYFSFLSLVMSFLIFSCTQEDNNNNGGGFQGIVNGVLVAINMDYLASYTTKTVGINSTAGAEKWTHNNGIYTLYAPFNGSLCTVSPLDINNPFNIANSNTRIYKTDINTGLLSDSVRYTNNLYISTVFDNNAVYQLGYNSTIALHIAKYNLFNNTPLWVKKVASGISYNIIAVNNVLFYSSNDTIYAADGSNSNVIWSTKLNVSSSTGSFMLYNNNKIYFGANGSTANFYCLNAQTGAVLWSDKIISANKYQPSYSIEGNNLIVAEAGNTTTDAKNIYAIDKNTGADLWSFTANKSIRSGPTIKNNKVFFSAADSSLYCLNASNGSLLWKYNSNDIFNSGFYRSYFNTAPIVADSAVIFSMPGKVYALSTISGSLMWQYTFSGTPSNRETYLNAFVLRDSIYYPGGGVIKK